MVITDYLVDKMVEKKIISENKEFYIYGLNNGFMIIANFLTALFLSYIVKKTDILLFFLISFMPLRSYCGGFHCKSRFLCYVISNIIIVILLVSQPFFYKNIVVLIIISFANFIYLFFTQTEGNQTRCLENYEIIQYTKIKRIALLVIIFIGIVLFFTKYFLYSTTLFTSIDLAAILVILEKTLKIKVRLTHNIKGT